MTHITIVFSFLAVAFATLVMLSATHASAVKASKEELVRSPSSNSLVVVELYTSQGCSSCPPADRVLAELATHHAEKVLPLSFHVDYWNYIGWKDPFSSKANTRRQHAYGTAFKRNNVYTPQAIIGGTVEMVGSSRAKVIKEVARQAKTQNDAPEIHISRHSGGIVVNVAEGQGRAKILAIEYLPEHTTKVLRGENRGRTLTNYNIVTNVRSIGTWDGSEKTISLETPTSDGLAIVLQTEGETPNTILSAARLQ